MRERIRMHIGAPLLLLSVGVFAQNAAQTPPGQSTSAQGTAPQGASPQDTSIERGVLVVPDVPEAAPQQKPAQPATSAVPDMPSSVDSEQVLSGYRPGPQHGTIGVQRIEVIGNTVLDPRLFAAAVASFEHRSVSFEELETLRLQLSALYVAAGYVNSGVVLGEPAVTADGVVHLKAVQGRLSSIDLSGNHHLTDAYIKTRIINDVGPVLNVHALEQSLRLMQAWPTIAQVNAELVPGPVPGTSVLELKVHENDTVNWSIGANNHRSPTVGEDQGVVTLSDPSLTHHGDYLTASYGQSRGLGDGSAVYGLPLTSRDLTLEAHYTHGHSNIVEAPFERLDIISVTTAAGLRVYRPLIKTLSQDATLSLEVERRFSSSSLLGVPFSFSPGDVNGKSNDTALRLRGDWSRRWSHDSLAVRATLSRGFPWFEATNVALPGAESDGRFTAELVQAQYAHQVDWRKIQLVARLTAQATHDPLLAVEKLAIGGVDTVRGYLENELIRDQGTIASVEVRIPVHLDDAGANWLGLSIAPFFDYGSGRDRLGSLPSFHSQTLMSDGVGLIWNGWKALYAEVYYGHQIDKVPTQGSSLQDHGVSFLLYFRGSF